MERLQKIISHAGVASRREAERMILAGRVCLNGEVVKELGIQAEEGIDEITVDGVLIGTAAKHVYFLLNKPKGYLCTVKDDRGRPTVIQLLPDVKDYIYPVGRLDYNTEGLLLLTNDGEMMNALLHPKYEINKTYIAKVQGIVSEDKIRLLQKGIELEDGMTAPAKAELLDISDKGWSKVRLTIHEGRNRQVRRMMKAVGHEVITLNRTVFAGLTLRDVPRGKYRSLTAEEITHLRHLAGIQES